MAFSCTARFVLSAQEMSAKNFGELTTLIRALDAGEQVLRDAGMQPARLLVSGTAFFPVGRGLAQRDDYRISNKPVMVLGQDFGTVAYVEALDQRGREDFVNSVTWRELRDLLPKSGILLEECFFTNVYMGLRRDGPMVGVLPAAKNAAYRAWCADFLRLQLSLQKLRMIIVLGMEPARFVASVFSDAAAWMKASYKSLQESGELVQTLRFDWGATKTVVIPHPSFLHANQHRCRWEDAAGREALERMLGDVFAAALEE